MVVGKPPLTPPKEGKSEFDVVDELLVSDCEVVRLLGCKVFVSEGDV
jgi:hypothetical protein